MAVGTAPFNDPRSDAQLIDAINCGEDAAFEAIYHRHRDWVVTLAFRFTGNRDDALDVMQETFVYVLSKFPGFELRAAFKTFLYPAVKHIAIRKRTLTRRHQTGDGPLESIAAPPAPTPAGETGDDLAALVSALPSEQSEVLLMRFVDGLSLAEIAAALDVPVGTVKSRLHRAVEALRDDPRIRKFHEP